MKFFYFHIIFHLILHITFSLKLTSNLHSKDPFIYLGIDELNSQKMLSDINKNISTYNNNDLPNYSIPRLTSLDDLPSFFKLSHLYEDEALPILSKFLIQDNIILQKNGVIYDQTGFDGLNRIEIIHPKGSEERLKQRARSAASIFIRKNDINKVDYEAFGVEEEKEENVNGWKVYKVLMVGEKGDNSFVKVCLPIDEQVPAMCNVGKRECKELEMMVEKEKEVNKEYLEKIRETGFFKKRMKRKEEKNIEEMTANKKEEKGEMMFKQKEKGIDELKKEIKELKKEVEEMRKIIMDKEKVIKSQEDKIIKLSKL